MRLLKPILLTLALAFLLPQEGMSQYVPNYDTTSSEEADASEPKDNKASLEDMYVGVDFNLWLYSQAFFLELSPYVGYNVWKDLSVGAGIFYQYIRDGGVNAHIHSYGVSIFSRYLFFERFFLQAEYEYAKVGYNPTTRFLDPGTSNAIYLGAGYCQPLGDLGYFQSSLYYDFLQEEYNPHPRLHPLLPLHLRFGLVFFL